MDQMQSNSRGFQDYCHELITSNPGSIVKLATIDAPIAQDVNPVVKFLRLYFCLDACKKSFLTCMKIIGIKVGSSTVANFTVEPGLFACRASLCQSHIPLLSCAKSTIDFIRYFGLRLIFFSIIVAIHLDDITPNFMAREHKCGFLSCQVSFLVDLIVHKVQGHSSLSFGPPLPVAQDIRATMDPVHLYAEEGLKTRYLPPVEST
ncbi:uncharacterized protein G2W53_010870 [Senna tora]|uniref:Uncharacterized protein n=1 Tax=Senna tora TaxID=362788 RepID=A0A835CBU1_9FABA|nr:uncharacterized protein G2W53_010870 [Senna tora]